MAAAAAPVRAAGGGDSGDEEGEGSRGSEVASSKHSNLDVGALITVEQNEYPDVVGYTFTPDGGGQTTAYAIPVLVHWDAEGSPEALVVAIPASIFPRKVAGRAIPEDLVLGWAALRCDCVEAVNVEEVGRGPESGETATVVSMMVVKVKVEFLTHCVLLDAFSDSHVAFRRRKKAPFFPVSALLAAAVSKTGKFDPAYQTGSEGAGRAAGRAIGAPAAGAARTGSSMEDRMDLIEQSLIRLSASLPAALAAGAAQAAQPRADPSSRRQPPKAQKDPLLPVQGPAGRADLGAAQGARAASLLSEAAKAGIPEDQTRKLMALLGQRHGRLTAEPGAGRPPLVTVLGEDDEEEEAAQALGLAAASAATVPPLERAVLELAAISKVLAERHKHQSTDPLDRALDGSLASGSTQDGSLHSKRGAAALRYLRRALEDSPETISKPIRDRMNAMNRSSLEAEASAASGSADRPPDPLFWIEHRSRITCHRSNVQWAWIVGTILKCMLNKRFPEAEARAFLALAAADQIAVDQGSWLIAWELQLLEEPPYASFQARNVASMGTRLPLSKLIDERWLEAILSRLRDIEDSVERRKKLEAKPGGSAGGSGAARQYSEPAASNQYTSPQGQQQQPRQQNRQRAKAKSPATAGGAAGG
jgi:hypothetical protein